MKSKSMTKPKKNGKILYEKDKIRQLEEENLYLKNKGKIKRINSWFWAIK